MPVPPAFYPDEGAVPYNEPYTAVLNPGQKVVAEWEPTQSGTTFFMPILAATKAPHSTYTIEADGTTIYGPDHSIPPTDVDDLTTVWWPPQEWGSNLRVTVKRLSTASAPQEYHIQPIGWEE